VSCSLTACRTLILVTGELQQLRQLELPTVSLITGIEPDSRFPQSRERPAPGRSDFTHSEIFLVLKLVKRLLDTGVSLQQIRIAVEQLAAAGISDLTNTTLMSDGARVYLCTSQDEVIDLLGQGQGVFGIAIGRVLREVEATLVDFAAEEAAVHDELAARRARKIS